MEYLIVKLASALTDQERADRGITGIPLNWPIESYPYVDQMVVPPGFDSMSVDDFNALKANNQASYDAWLQSLRPKKVEAPTEVVTQTEKPDKSLVLASIEVDFNGNTAVAQIKVPGTLGTFGRFVAGGYGFTDVFGWGDRISKVQMIDKDFVYAGVAGFYPATPIEAGIPGTEGLTWAEVMPDGVVLGGYHDEDVYPSFSGWRLWCDDGNQGGVDIDPLGGYGRLPALAYLTITFEKTATSQAAHAAVNLWWGKEDPTNND